MLYIYIDTQRSTKDSVDSCFGPLLVQTSLQGGGRQRHKPGPHLQLPRGDLHLLHHLHHHHRLLHDEHLRGFRHHHVPRAGGGRVQELRAQQKSG